MKATLFCFTAKGAEICEKVQNILIDFNYTTISFSKYQKTNLVPLNETISSLTGQAFRDSRVIIFIGAMGIAVRSIAPFLKGKA